MTMTPKDGDLTDWYVRGTVRLGARIMIPDGPEDSSKW